MKNVAITWDSALEDENPYWASSALMEVSENQNGLRVMTYGALERVQAILRRKIVSFLEKVSDDLPADEDMDTIFSVPVAIAIPEGFWLPLAVSVIHALNRPIRIKNKMLSVVLIPMEPTEGEDRLVLMFSDCRPALILVASECDYERITGIIQKLDSFNDPTIVSMNSRTHFVQVKKAEILDIRDILEDLSDNSTTTDGSSSSGPIGNRISHIVYTSGTTGKPKGCVSSIKALSSYLVAKNRIHQISQSSRVLLASAVSFDPCFSDILATFQATATLVLSSRRGLREDLAGILQRHCATHVLCTPTLWSTLGVEKERLPHLERIFLGGEPIPRYIIRRWARTDSSDHTQCQLFATYGVTEACVYQTAGEVFRDMSKHHVGTAFSEMIVSIANTESSDTLEEKAGEVVVAGDQVDEFSQYLNLAELTGASFGRSDTGFFYRTGDLGFVDEETSNLHIIGRMKGHGGMVKLNGIRLELGEIEAALVDEAAPRIVVEAIARVWTSDDGEERQQLAAYIVISPSMQEELGISEIPPQGVACSVKPLLTLLYTRCRRRAKVTPQSFVIIPYIPLSPTGKRNRKGLFHPVKATWMANGQGSPLLMDYGNTGKLVSGLLISSLNIQAAQQKLLTSDSSFAMIGGDSLAATRIVRAIFASHNKIHNNRRLGGEYGSLNGPFSVSHLLKASTLGDYVDWLDSNGICQDGHAAESRRPDDSATKMEVRDGDGENTLLYESLVEAIIKSCDHLGLALIADGADPNLGGHSGRLGKVRSRLDQREIFKSSPLHLACLRASPHLVTALISAGAKLSSPDASGMFPLHLAASRDLSQVYNLKEDEHRTKCVEILFNAGTPVSMKDGNKQTAIHAAARAGNVETLRYCLKRWVLAFPEGHALAKGLDWRDRWGRTPVHWAVLNGHLGCLELLVSHGCKPNPPKIKLGKRTTAASESPIEMCERLYSGTDIGEKMALILKTSE